MNLTEAKARRTELEATLNALIAQGNAPTQGHVPAHVGQPLTFAANANDAWRIEGQLIRLDDIIESMEAAVAARKAEAQAAMVACCELCGGQGIGARDAEGNHFCNADCRMAYHAEAR